MASFKKNPNGTYTAVVYVGRDSNNKNIRKQITRDTLKECKSAARELEEDVENKHLNNYSMMKVSDFMNKWVDVNRPLLASTTLKAYKIYIDVHFKPWFGKSRMCDVTEMNIKEYIAQKLEDLSPTTVRKHFFTLKKIFYDALKIKSPCIDVKAPKKSDYKPRVPTEEEFKKICNVFREQGNQDESIILLAGWCGMRRGEIFALKWDDIDEKNGTLRIDEAKALQEEGYKFEYKKPKSDNGTRTIAVPDYLMDLLKDIRKTVPQKLKHKLGEIPEITPEVFRYIPQTFTNKYFDIIDDPKYELPHIRFHDLRHYHACLLYKNNVPDLYAAERLGHDIHVLKSIYQHLGLEERRNLDDKIKDIFKA